MINIGAMGRRAVAKRYALEYTRNHFRGEGTPQAIAYQLLEAKAPDKILRIRLGLALETELKFGAASTSDEKTRSRIESDVRSLLPSNLVERGY